MVLPAPPEPMDASLPSPNRRRHSDELATATAAPLAPLAPLLLRPQGRGLCESPDFGREPREARDWPSLSQSTRMKGDLFRGYKDKQAEQKCGMFGGDFGCEGLGF